MPPRTLYRVNADSFLYLKLCIFRPFILLSMPNKEGAVGDLTLTTNQSSAQDELIRQYCHWCLHVAYQMSKIIYDNLSDPYCTTGWHQTHCKSAFRHLKSNWEFTMNEQLYSAPGWFCCRPTNRHIYAQELAMTSLSLLGGNAYRSWNITKDHSAPLQMF